jgi:hypothetical protein
MEALKETPVSFQNSYVAVILITILMVIIIVGIFQYTAFTDVVENWEKYRCDISVLPFASFYGKNAEENFNYCMSSMLNSKASAFTGPFASILTSIVGGMMVFMESLNSFRVMLGTLTGGVGKVFKEFTDRFNFLYNNIQTTAVRMQFLFKRLMSSFISIIFLGSSAVTAGMNFGDTFLFKFLDTFCFDPETVIEVKGKGVIPVKSVELGAVLADGSRVTSVYRFYSRGVPMVIFNGSYGKINVSTNHYMKDAEDKWIRCEDHPDARLLSNWGSDRPLVCFDTDTHRIPIGGYVFSDYDETNATDVPTMKLVDSVLNNAKMEDLPTHYDWSYMPCMRPETDVKMKDGSKKALKDITIGDVLETGTVIGVVARYVRQVCYIGGAVVSPSTGVWVPCSSASGSAAGKWIRAGFLAPVHTLDADTVFMMPLVMSSSTIPIVGINGEEFMVRDFMELMSHDIEGPTEEAMLGKK